MLMAALTTAILREAAKRGIKLIDEFLNPDVLVTLIPSENTIKRGAVLWQGVDDQLNEDDFAGTEAVFFINDAGNKKKKSHRLMACYSSILGKIIIRHVGSSTVLSGQSRDGGCCGGLSQGREEGCCRG